MPAASAVVLLLAGVLSLWVLARLVGRRAGRVRPRSAARVLAALIIGVVLILAGEASAVPLYAWAAGVAAIATALGIALRRELAATFGGPAYAVPSLSHRAPGTPGTMTAPGAFAAAAGAFLTAALAFRLRLLGPSDPALVALAAYLGILVECWLEGILHRRRGLLTGAAAAAATLAAAIAAAFVVLLP